MDYFLYILYSPSIEKHYIGITHDIQRPLHEHNDGISKKAWTRRAQDWQIIHTEKFKNKHEAQIRETQIKRYKGGNAFKKLITCHCSSAG